MNFSYLFEKSFHILHILLNFLLVVKCFGNIRSMDNSKLAVETLKKISNLNKVESMKTTENERCVLHISKVTFLHSHSSPGNRMRCSSIPPSTAKCR